VEYKSLNDTLVNLCIYPTGVIGVTGIGIGVSGTVPVVGWLPVTVPALSSPCIWSRMFWHLAF
jgi:hypothetical protein